MSNSTKTLLHEARNNVIAALQNQRPDIYVSGGSAAAETVNAGFFVNEAHTDIAIPLVINPMWGIPREDPDSQLPVGITLKGGNAHLDMSITYSEMQSIGAGDIKIHIRAGGEFAPTATCPLVVTVVYSSDASTSSNTTSQIVATASPTNGEYVFDVPAFSQFVLVNIHTCQ